MRSFINKNRIWWNPRILRGVVMPLACFVLFWTVYALILPAVTQERQPFCGQTEHTHGDACYDDTGALVCELPEHTHTDACYSDPSADLQTLADWEPAINELSLTGTWPDDVLSVAKSQLGYHASESNYTVSEAGTRNCYSRYGAWAEQPYAPWNGEFVRFCLHYAQVPDDALSEADTADNWLKSIGEAWPDAVTQSEWQPGDLVFFDRDEDGTADSVAIAEKLLEAEEDAPERIKLIAGDIDGAVRYLAIPTAQDKSIRYVSLSAVRKAYDALHAEHTDEAGQSDLWLSGTLRFEGEDFVITAEFDTAAMLPIGTVLSVREILPDTEEYEAYFSQSEQNLNHEIIRAARFFDVTFLCDGKEIEPAAPVQIHTQYVQPAEDDEDARVIHFSSDGTELLPVETEQSSDEITGFVHQQDDFSVIGYLMTTSANETDVGPEALPVDYYVYIDGSWQCVGSTATGWLGNYNIGAGEATWTDYNRDYITTQQAASILAPYGFDAGDTSAARKLCYQMKKANDNDTATDTACYSDTNVVTIGGKTVIPISRHSLRANANAGYNLYFIPGNTTVLSNISVESIPTSASAFYTVRAYDPQGLTGQTFPAPVLVATGKTAQVQVGALSGNLQWKCVNSGWQPVTFTQSQSGSTVTLTVQNVTQTIFFIPESADAKTPYSHNVHFMVYLDGAWTDVGMVSTYYKMDGHARFFITAAQAESVLSAYGFRASEYTYDADRGNQFAHQLSNGTPGIQFYSDNDAWKLSDGSWAIGLGYAEEANYYLYYLPDVSGKPMNTPNEYAAAHEECHFWTVSVRDSNQLIYSAGELNAMKQFVRNGGGCKVSLKTEENIFWSAYGLSGRKVSERSEVTADGVVITLSGIDQPVQITATQSNPEYTVQYYADTPVFSKSGSTTLSVIDTSGKNLPSNKTDPSFTTLGLENTGIPASGKNNGTTTNYYRVATNRQEVKLYEDVLCQFHRQPDVSYVDKLAASEGYTLTYVGVLKPGKFSNSTSDDDFTWYSANGVGFTNLASEADANTILIEKGSVIRLFYEPTVSSYINSMNLYDYDINSARTLAEGSDSYRTGITGINSPTNYGTSRNGQTTWNSGKDLLAFGNKNTGTGLADYKFDGYYLNQHSGRDSVNGCTFGIADSLDSNGNIVYNEWLTVPKLFDESDDANVTGKHTYRNGQLTFERTGDTYVLTGASHPETGSVSNLNYFFNPSPNSGTVYSTIFTNDFWPMDSVAAENRTDPLFGADGAQIPFAGFAAGGNPTSWWTEQIGYFPPSDDGKNHNNYFGMHFAVNFSLTTDYVGPLEYYFFGDDDLWVFLDNQLICDLGGVHLSMGEYVNLRDYLPIGSSGTHTLTVFYTERGASGSTCWMSFTLPTVSGSVTGRDVGSLEVSKTLQHENGTQITDSEERFSFRVDLLTAQGGSALQNTFAYSRSDGTYGSIRSGQTVTLRGGETLRISGIPAGTWYTVRELDSLDYTTTVNGAAGYVVSGEIASDQSARADYINTAHYRLPDSGGPGTDCFLILGIGLLALFACCLFIRLHKNKGSTDSA